jgi:hypothetical protein
MSANKTPKPDSQNDVTVFMKNLWFFLFYFLLLIMIASFGLIAEA